MSCHSACAPVISEAISIYRAVKTTKYKLLLMICDISDMIYYGGE